MSTSSTQLLGLFLWRAGLFFVGAWSLYRSAGWLLDAFDIPPRAAAGLALMFTGAVMVALSLILERMKAAKLEGDLTQ